MEPFPVIRSHGAGNAKRYTDRSTGSVMNFRNFFPSSVACLFLTELSIGPCNDCISTSPFW